MAGPARIAQGLLTAAARPVGFHFDGVPLTGLEGDTLASALLASGRRLIGRSFKYHRPRGVMTAGPEEPCALVDVISAAGREPNRLATTLPLTEGLRVESQNRWPSLAFDLLAFNDLVSRFLPAGFYYKTFMAPGWAWERIYEPLIRRAAGLGRLEAEVGAHATPAEIVHDHTDVLVVGAGAAGLAAAERLSAAGLSVLLAEQDVLPGGGTLLDPRWSAWRAGMLARLGQLPGVRLLTRTTVIGAYGHGVCGALETLEAGQSERFGGLRERLHVVRARRVLLASGATERLVAFPGNDVPGVLLAGAALAYLRRYGVAAGRQPAFLLNNDEAYEAVFALADAGVRASAVIDPRITSLAAERARAQGIEVLAGAVVSAVRGRSGVRAVLVRLADGAQRWIGADALLVSGGFNPTTALAAQLGARLTWREPLAAFAAELEPATGRIAGGAAGVCGLAAAARDGAATGAALAAELGAAAPQATADAALPDDSPATPLAPLWEVRAPGKAFVDLQNDVTAEDVRLACREGYEHVEHMKRYTTCGMATDQGRIGGLVASAVLAAARGVPLAEVGVAKPRPYLEPVPFAALAGGEVRAHYRPRRRLPLHDWHEGADATFVNTGLWLRPLVYSRAAGWEPVLEEARAVRRAVGVTDVSTLGKIDVQGPDAARFLDFIYANTFSTLAVGRARYGIMLREDGMLFDDGTTSRLGPEHFVVTTTTANSTAVLEHLEFHLQSVCRELDVVLTDVCDQWAQFAVAGPRSREVLSAVAPGLDLGNAAFPFMAVAAADIAGVPGRVFRISFSGELAYEIAVPAQAGRRAWEAIIEAGRPLGIRPYGLDALNTLRIEKGHVTTAELNGNTCADDLGFARMLKKAGDYIGRALATRPGLTAADRLQLVGVRPLDRRQRLRNGMHLLSAEAPGASLGYVTSSTPSVELEGWVGLALLAAGRQRIGAQLLGVSVIHDERVALEIVSPHMLDPENTRVRA
jgi:methylglutamate dehydrogenase subunit C